MILGGPKEFGPHKRNLRGQNNDFGGTKRVFGPHTPNFRGQKNDLVLPNSNWGDQMSV